MRARGSHGGNKVGQLLEEARRTGCSLIYFEIFKSVDATDKGVYGRRTI
jgi:hypothetical protein